MRGRDLFRAASPIVFVLDHVLRLFPASFARWCLLRSRSIPGSIGLGIRYVLVRRLAANCGSCVAIFPTVFLFGVESASIGANVSIHEMTYIDGSGGLSIGNDVSIAHACTIMTTEHDYANSDLAIRDADVTRAPVHLGDDVWIGAGARVLAGVTIGSHCVIGAGAVVTHDIPAYSVAAGIPAHAIGSVPRKEGRTSCV